MKTKFRHEKAVNAFLNGNPGAGEKLHYAKVARLSLAENLNIGENSAGDKAVRISLAGNPNAGKTSLFNALTGARQHVGNYPGVTVEKREGYYVEGGRRVSVLDLPGTYSLTSFSPEEKIALFELLKGRPDVVVVVADATALKRSLVILAQLMQITPRLVLCLNMADEAKLSGQRLDLELLAQLLGIPVVETVGHRGIGIQELKKAIAQVVSSPRLESRLVLGDRLERSIEAVRSELLAAGLPQEGSDWIATKLLEGDSAAVATLLEPNGQSERALETAARERAALESESGTDIMLYVTECYYGFVDGLVREVLLRQARADARATSDRIDEVLANRILGLPFFFLVMYLIFWVTFTVGDYPMRWLEQAFGALGGWIGGLWPAGTSSILRSILVDGIIGGVGGVLVFLPNIMLLFLGLIFLEDTGYMARAAFLVDRVMHRFGLHGRSFIPLITGFGCSIPGIMATRTLENERDRLATMMVVPLMSCGARLPIWMLLIPAFFPLKWRAPALWFIYMIGIGLALVLALVLRRSFLKGEDAPFVMELPPYRLPTLKSVVLRVFQRAWMYLHKAGTLILAISVVMWFLVNYPRLERTPVDEEIAAGRIVVAETIAGDVQGLMANGDGGRAPQTAADRAATGKKVLTQKEVDRRRAAERKAHSMAGRVGRMLEPVIAPLGFDWKLGTAMVGAFAAKEVFVAQLGVIYSVGEVNEGSEALRAALRRDYSPLTGVSLMLFLLIATPCMATVAVMRRESGSWKWPLLQFGGLTALAYVISLTVYQVGGLLV